MRRWLAISGAGVVAAAAVLGGEAVYVARREYAAASSAPEVTGVFGSGAPLRLAVLGDSTAAGLGVSRVEDTVAGQVAAGLGRHTTVVGLGVSGSRAADLESQVGAALDADVAVILIGANDATHLTSLGSVREDLGAAVRRLRAAGVAVVVGTCPDMGAATAFPPPLRQLAAWRGRRVGAAERSAVRDAGGVAVDIGAETGPEFRRDPERYLSEDEFHPSADGYRLWAEALLPAVRAAAGT